ncbi:MULTISPECIES: flagellar hook-basal body complex protein FliE [Brevibacillus]|uniref:Flagellar hook-basal body complex protein FliE n=1 Tax=Brevibacillus invocatus TaxID=173959 RepID=A0A3M8CM47_9BACL|nr:MULTISPECIES: flagellar hook-basal body complex protein FliE [Brevibacillus]MCM3078887.1 flagellar hook-basal body complex protein FliE [Brevibacillus invocatus]MCM3429011.1 flagellar hook-basal body complex protein FliE [Brevibacillus invocatus]MDH4617188.1 flagellar hook-basal body complex protein FliE [Brevibacillus sp. AY1]RNB76347.1 flagellar hook-basal body complex protein FliE [Brevibacillus invocatus]
MDINAISQLSPIRTQNVQSVQTPAEVTKGFSSFLSDALNDVNQAQVASSRMQDAYATGNVELHQVTIASQKASVMLDLTMQVRNKVIESYQEIMRMSI